VDEEEPQNWRVDLVASQCTDTGKSDLGLLDAENIRGRLYSFVLEVRLVLFINTFGSIPETVFATTLRCHCVRIIRQRRIHTVEE
jgi:hypothetical protein